MEAAAAKELQIGDRRLDRRRQLSELGLQRLSRLPRDARQLPKLADRRHHPHLRRHLRHLRRHAAHLFVHLDKPMLESLHLVAAERELRRADGAVLLRLRLGFRRRSGGGRRVAAAAALDDELGGRRLDRRLDPAEARAAGAPAGQAQNLHRARRRDERHHLDRAARRRLALDVQRVGARVEERRLEDARRHGDGEAAARRGGEEQRRLDDRRARRLEHHLERAALDELQVQPRAAAQLADAHLGRRRREERDRQRVAARAALARAEAHVRRVGAQLAARSERAAHFERRRCSSVRCGISNSAGRELDAELDLEVTRPLPIEVAFAR